MMSLIERLFVVLLTVTTVCAQNCPPLIFPNNVPDNCQVFVAIGNDGCRTILLTCERNNRKQCQRFNEIFYQCSNECEPSCRDPLPNCNARCTAPKCQCRPNFLRDATGNCVPPNKCGIRGLDCLFDQQCGFGRECRNRQCVDRPLRRDHPFCRFDRECSGDGVCVSGQCRRRGGRCNNGGDCFGGQVCINAFCVDVDRDRDLFACNSDRDCRHGHECRHGHCKERQRDLETCDNNFQCRDGRTCVEGRCVRRDSGVCDDESNCPRGAACIRGRCEDRNGGCNHDRDCGQLEACIRDRCISRVPDRRECRHEHDCDDDRTCDNGFCVRRNRGRCHFDRECSGGQNCVFGRCVGGDFGPGGDGDFGSDGGRPGGDGDFRPDGPRGDRPVQLEADRRSERGGRGDQLSGNRPVQLEADRRSERGGGRDSRVDGRVGQDGDEIRRDATECGGGCDGPGHVCRNGRCVILNGDDNTQDRVTAVPSQPGRGKPGKDSVVLIGSNRNQRCVPDCPKNKLCIKGNCVTL